MASRHATGVVLLSGWLLVTPPGKVSVTDEPTVIYTQEPIEEWTQQSAHDTARECERARDREVTTLQENARAETDPKWQRLNGYLALSYAMARCVPAESYFGGSAEAERPSKPRKRSQ